jgi:anti-sigma regulatory factor (Ser/Thr protein kinase)
MPVARRFRRDLPEVPAARRFVTEALAATGSCATDDLLLVVSELATNAVRHGAGAMEVRVHADAGQARVEVLDDGGAQVSEPPAAPPLDSVGGRGLHLVRSVSQAWGTGLDARGRTLVWAELQVPRPNGSRLAVSLGPAAG